MGHRRDVHLDQQIARQIGLLVDVEHQVDRVPGGRGSPRIGDRLDRVALQRGAELGRVDGVAQGGAEARHGEEVARLWVEGEQGRAPAQAIAPAGQVSVGADPGPARGSEAA